MSARESPFFFLGSEPVLRIGLETNAKSVTITSSDSTLTAATPGEQPKPIASARAVVEPRVYRPPVIEYYRLEIRGIGSQPDAEKLAFEVGTATGERCVAVADSVEGPWKVVVGEPRRTPESISELRNLLSEKGFDGAVVTTERKTEPAVEAILLSQQIKSPAAAKTEVRSLIKGGPARPRVVPSSGAIDPGIREISVTGSSPEARFGSLEPISFGSLDDRSSPVKLDGKSYRGRLEVFVNSRGTLTVVNVVGIEDYLLGVVPKELGLPAIEAQKAQAVAARTYAISNANAYAKQGFDLVPTVWSQVYGGVAAETSMGTRAVRETAGIVATHSGKPINALYTSTCGGRTEDSGNVFEFNLPYLKGVECSLDGRSHFEPFTVKSTRELVKTHHEGDLQMVRLASRFAVNGFVLATNRFGDNWLDTPPVEVELKSWINQIATRAGRPFPTYSPDLVRSEDFAVMLAKLLYGAGQADTLLTDSDVAYHLSFADAGEIAKRNRAEIAMLFRDGFVTLFPDGNFHPQRPMSRRHMLRLIGNLYVRRKWMPAPQTAVARPSADGKLVVRNGKTDRSLNVSAGVFLFRQFGDHFFQVRETSVVGGEEVAFYTNPAGEVVYLEVSPTAEATVAEKMSPFTFWDETLTLGEVQSRISRYAKGFGTLVDMNVVKTGYSRRAVELEVVGTAGTARISRGRIRSALRLKEQLFHLEKRRDAAGKVVSFSFRGRGWGHGVGMCQYGAFGLAKMGQRYDQILKHYYTGVELTKSY
jgi:stage II sporulation protein D